jgi:hypothetical protein
MVETRREERISNNSSKRVRARESLEWSVKVREEEEGGGGCKKRLRMEEKREREI